MKINMLLIILLTVLIFPAGAKASAYSSSSYEGSTGSEQSSAVSAISGGQENTGETGWSTQTGNNGNGNGAGGNGNGNGNSYGNDHISATPVPGAVLLLGGGLGVLALARRRFAVLR